MLSIFLVALLTRAISTSPTGPSLAAPTNLPSRATGKLPALGWNTWNAYGCNINEQKVLAAAQSFVDLGLKAAGYEYVNIDDCWSLTSRNATTKQIVPDPQKFPSGIKGVADKIHALGLKIGIYSDAGTATCAGYPGSLGNEVLDASTFNAWGIDYLKYDNCNVPANWSDTTPDNGDWYNSNSSIRYRQMGGALGDQPRPIHYSLCLWGNYKVSTWGARVGHSWRMTGDAAPNWSFITYAMRLNAPYLSAVDFYAHNDIDMMEIGNGGLTPAEDRTHFAVWTFMKSPILLGTTLSALTQAQIAIITNKELLAFHQDATIGAAALPFKATTNAPVTDPPEYYSGKSSSGTHVLIVNTGSSTATKTFALSQVPGLGTGTFKVHDMWTGKDLSGTYSSSSTFSVQIASHDNVAYRLTPV